MRRRYRVCPPGRQYRFFSKYVQKFDVILKRPEARIRLSAKQGLVLEDVVYRYRRQKNSDLPRYAVHDFDVCSCIIRQHLVQSGLLIIDSAIRTKPGTIEFCFNEWHLRMLLQMSERIAELRVIFDDRLPEVIEILKKHIHSIEREKSHKGL